MSKYIDADRLIRRLENRTYKAVPNFIKMVEEQEAADVQEVVKEWCNERNCIIVAREDFPRLEVRYGRWEHDGYDFPHGNDWVHCSVCGKRGINVPADLTPYCPNCGAKMDGEEE